LRIENRVARDDTIFNSRWLAPRGGVIESDGNHLIASHVSAGGGES